MFGKNGKSLVVNFLNQPLDFLVYQFGCFLTVRFGEVIAAFSSGVIIGQSAHRLAHSVIAYHSVGHLGKPFQVVQSTRRRFSVHDFFGYTASDERAHLVGHLGPRHNLAFFRQIPGSTQGLSPRHYRHLEKRVGVREEPAYYCVTGLVMSYGLLFFRCDNLVLSFQTSYYPVHSIEEILLIHTLLVAAGSSEGGFVADIRDVGTGEPWSVLCEEFNVEVVGKFDTLEMHLEDFFPFLQIRKVYVNLAVETSCPEQSLVQYVCTVGGCENDDSGIGVKSIHLSKELIQCAFPFIIG